MDTRFLPPPRETYQAAYDKACGEMANLNPVRAAALAGIQFVAAASGEGEFRLAYFGRDFTIAYPDLAVAEAASGRVPSLVTQIILLHHLLTADGAPLTGEWVAFRYLPDGRVYEAAFESRAPRELARTFGTDCEGFIHAAESLDGHRLGFGDASFSFRPLPRLALACVLWLGDDEVPGSAKVLFDASAGHYMPTEDLAAIGGTLAGRLIGARSPQT
ncbi:MAG: DUF3786 domain-containing protein [Chloroflexota bacterium]